MQQLFYSLTALLATLTSKFHQSDVPTVFLGETRLIGRALPEFGLELYAGIPFAHPPVGELRLAPPVLRTRLDGDTFDATNFGHRCLQPGAGLEDSSEDCLTLNIRRPVGIPDSYYPLPVIVWTYGGGFAIGDSRYDATHIVARSVDRGTPVIYVNFNYRLGPLGFPTGTEAAAHGALNLGLHDELAALQWVQENIGFFGGDRHKVTLVGESAGAVIISGLLLSPSLRGLARGAIMESGSAASLGIYPPTRNEPDWLSFVKSVPECQSLPPESALQCLRTNATTEGLHKAINHINYQLSLPFPWMPVLDGDLFKDIPSRMLAKGEYSKLPFISGTNLNEGVSFIWDMETEEDLKHAFYGNVWRETGNLSAPPSEALQAGAAGLLERYPDDPALGAPFNTGNETFGRSTQVKRGAAILTDMWFTSLRRQANAASFSHDVPSYGYLFTHGGGPGHSAELWTIYGDPNKDEMARIMIDYWLSFATSGTPNDGLGSDRPLWETWSATDPGVMRLDIEHMGMIPDDFRTDGTTFMNENAHLWRH